MEPVDLYQSIYGFKYGTIVFSSVDPEQQGNFQICSNLIHVVFVLEHLFLFQHFRSLIPMESVDLLQPISFQFIFRDNFLLCGSLMSINGTCGFFFQAEFLIYVALNKILDITR